MSKQTAKPSRLYYGLAALIPVFGCLIALAVASLWILDLDLPGTQGTHFDIEDLTRVIVPAMIPGTITALRISVTIAWLVVVAAEMIAVQSGLGYLILDARNALRMDYVINGMIVIGLIGFALDRIMLMLQRRVSWDKNADLR